MAIKTQPKHKLPQHLLNLKRRHHPILQTCHPPIQPEQLANQVTARLPPPQHRRVSQGLELLLPRLLANLQVPCQFLILRVAQLYSVACGVNRNET